MSASLGRGAYRLLRWIQAQPLTRPNLLLFTNGQILDLLIYRALVDGHASRSDLSSLFGSLRILFSFGLGVPCISFCLFPLLFCSHPLSARRLSRILLRLRFALFFQIHSLTGYPVNTDLRALGKDQTDPNGFALAAISVTDKGNHCLLVNGDTFVIQTGVGGNGPLAGFPVARSADVES